MIYLDNAATTKIKQEVVEAMMPYFTDKWYNPSSLYDNATHIKKDIDNAREKIAKYINADTKEIYFTSGGSESNCWAIQGFVHYCIARGVKPCVITSMIEHKSIIECVNNLNGTDIEYVEVDSDGFVDIRQLQNIMLREKLCGAEILISIQFANNEIGTIQHIKEIANEVHRFNGVFHTDAVQAFGQIPIDVKELGIDMMSVSGHKIECPKGIGALYIRKGVAISPLIYGSQMDGMRGGTENVPYIIGMAKAIELIRADEEYDLRMTVLRNNFITGLKALGCNVNGSLDRRLPNNINITFLGNITGEALLYTLDMCGIQIGTGSACNSKSIEPSYVLKAIGLTDEEAMKTIRITLPHDITIDEIDIAMCEIEKAIKIINEGVC